MDVTSLNFIQLLPEINDTIRECDFIAIDTELSGLTRDRNNNRFDLPEERFVKLVDSSKEFFIMQFGLSCFTKSGPLHYNNRTYNFYIFPQPQGDEYGDSNRTFALQTESIQFLSSHGFDFNKLFKYGISYLTFVEKQAITAKFKSENKARSRISVGSSGLPTFVPQQMIDNCREWLTKTQKFVSEREKLEHQPLQQSSNRLELRNCASVNKRNIFKRVLECQPLIENIVTQDAYDKTKDEKYLVIEYVDKASKKEREKNELISAKGFLEILELVIVNRKPLVGHNSILDLIRIISQFIEPIKSDYSTFKETCNSLFPFIYDTKYIATLILDLDSLGNNQTRLEDLFNQLKESDLLPKIKVDNLNQPENGKQVAHKAGDDAYMCGFSFIVLCESYLIEKRKITGSRGDAQKSLAEEDIVIEEFSNRIHFSYSYDCKYFNLRGDDENPNRDHVFYMEIPESWQQEDIFQVFSQFGGVTFSRLSRTSVLCALRDPKQLTNVRDRVKKLKGVNYTIHSYESYLETFKRLNNK